MSSFSSLTQPSRASQQRRPQKQPPHPPRFQDSNLDGKQNQILDASYCKRLNRSDTHGETVSQSNKASGAQQLHESPSPTNKTSLLAADNNKQPTRYNHTATTTFTTLTSCSTPNSDEDTINLSHEINWYLQLNNSAIFQEFQLFYHTRHLSYCFKFILLIIHGLFLITIAQLINILSEDSRDDTGHTIHVIYETIITVTFFLLSVVGWKILLFHCNCIPIVFLQLKAWRIRIQAHLLKYIGQFFYATPDEVELSESLQRVEMSIRDLTLHKASPSATLRLSPMSSRVAPLPKFYASTPSALEEGVGMEEEERSHSDVFHETNLKAIFLILVQCLLLTCIFLSIQLSSCVKSNAWTGIIEIVCEFPNFYVIAISFWLFCVPYFIFSTLHDISIIVIWGVYLITVICEIVIIDMLEVHRVIPIIIAIIIWFVCVTMELQYHKLYIFFSHKKMTEKLEKQERNATIQNAQEMRHMIANVAHDLKTPLASFVTGVDYIQIAVDECKQICSLKPLDVNATMIPNFIPNIGNNVLLSNNFDSIQTCIGNIRNTHAFMLMIINRCIDYTKASKGMKLNPQYETINLLESLSLPFECVTNMQNRIGINIHPLPNELCPYIITDKQWLQENLLCLLSNAVKYSAEGQVDIRISLKDYMSHQAVDFPLCPWREDDEGVDGSGKSDCSKLSSMEYLSAFKSMSDKSHLPKQLMPYIRIEVEDTGIGMSEEAMASLFNPFKQTQRLAGGTGLGLYSLAKRLEALHGFYGVMKRRDGKQGSLFWFAIPYKPDTVYAQHMSKKPSTLSLNSKSPLELPVNANPLTKAAQELEGCNSVDCSTVTGSVPVSEAPSPSASERTLSISSTKVEKDNESVKHFDKDHFSVLVVDDSPPILKMCSLMLKRLGHIVATAENGAIAVKMVEDALSSSKSFDIILMDLQMPVMDGLEATKRIRDFEVNKKVRHKIIGMSANSDHDTSMHAIQAGADSFLPKPFNVDAIKVLFSDE